MRQTGGVLRGGVGQGMANAPADVRAAKRLMHGLGLYAPPPGGMGDDVDAGFDQAIRAFQDRNGLRVDGVMEPGGETERNLVAAERGDGLLPPLSADGLVLRRGGGAGGANDTADVGLVKQAMAALGRYAYDHTRPPPPYIDSRLVDSIRAFQRDNGLLDDGLIAPDDPGGLADSMAWFRRHLDAFRRQGLTTATENLEHYLSGKGTPKTYSREEARSFAPVRDAEAKNRGRFETRTFLGENTGSETAKRLKQMKPGGEPLRVNDYWEVGTDTGEFLYRVTMGNRDSAFAHGKTSVESKGNFTAQRVGDVIFIDGIVTHKWADEYNFDKGQPGAEQAGQLERHGRAKPFPFGAIWRQRVAGTVTVRNGKLVEPSFRWTDLP